MLSPTFRLLKKSAVELITGPKYGHTPWKLTECTFPNRLFLMTSLSSNRQDGVHSVLETNNGTMQGYRRCLDKFEPVPLLLPDPLPKAIQ